MGNSDIFCGNLPGSIDVKANTYEDEIIPTPRRVLVEECVSISLADLRQLFGRKELLKAAENARPVGIQLQCQHFSIYLMTSQHRIPNRQRIVSDTEVTKIWLCCFGCKRRVRKLFTYEKIPGSNILYMPLCRTCHGLTYQSRNCGKNIWWKKTAMPLKRLLNERQKLLNRKPTDKVQEKLITLDQLIWITRQRSAPKARYHRGGMSTDPAMRLKRPYRDISLIS